MEGGTPVIIPLPTGEPVFPATVYFQQTLQSGEKVQRELSQVPFCCFFDESEREKRGPQEAGVRAGRNVDRAKNIILD